MVKGSSHFYRDERLQSRLRRWKDAVIFCGGEKMQSIFAYDAIFYGGVKMQSFFLHVMLFLKVKRCSHFLHVMFFMEV